MKRSPFLLTAAAAITTLAVGQSLAPTARALPVVAVPDYQVRLESQKIERGLSGLIIQGRVTNTGRQPLVYTQVTPTLLDKNGNEVFRGHGYLTVSPLVTGRSTEFRACEVAAPAFVQVRMEFHEAGHLVPIQAPRVSAIANKARHPSDVRKG